MIWHDWQSVIISWQFANMGDGLNVRVKFDGIEREIDIGDGVDEVVVGVMFEVSGVSLNFHVSTLIEVWLTIPRLATVFVVLAIEKGYKSTGAAGIDRSC